jgi:virulence factor Mce-like protein
MKRVLASAAVLAAVVAFMILATGSGSGSGDPTYKIEVDNAFGLVNGADFKVAGVKAGTISAINLPSACVKGTPTACRAVVSVQVTQDGFGAFRSDASCQTRPQSLIGEYYIDCQPGQYGKQLKSGATIPVTHTQSTIPIDLIGNIMRMPYRQRLTLIINELGAAVAGRSGDLEAALRRAVPALTETDNLLNVLANDSHTINNLTANANSVITELANNSKDVANFIDEANKAATTSATQSSNIAATWRQLPGFLEQLRPAMTKLESAATTNLPVVQNLNASATQLDRLFKDLPGFSHASVPAIKALGKASVTGKTAVIAARPTVAHLNQFAKPTPELAQNLRIVLDDLDNRSRAVEPDKRSPGGKGYTGLEALLQFVFNQALAINTYTPLGHELAVDAFIDPVCSPYADQATIAQNLATYGGQARRCYAWLGPNQIGINEPDPTNPGACVPDPGGAPPGEKGPSTPVCKLSASAAGAQDTASAASTKSKSSATSASTNQPAASAASSSSGGGSSPTSSSGTSSASSGTSSNGSSSSSGSFANQAQALLNYLLAP